MHRRRGAFRDEILIDDHLRRLLRWIDDRDVRLILPVTLITVVIRVVTQIHRIGVRNQQWFTETADVSTLIETAETAHGRPQAGRKSGVGDSAHRQLACAWKDHPAE